MRLQETIKKILREGLDDKWTRDNQTVTLKELLDIVSKNRLVTFDGEYFQHFF